MHKHNTNPNEKTRLFNRNKMRRWREEGRYQRWVKNNPDKMKEYRKRHRHHDITKTEYENMLKVFDYSCAYCGLTLQESYNKYGEKLHNDHVDEDGYNDLRNDVPACKVCNSLKHQNDMEEWYRKQEFFSQERLDKINWWITEGYKNYIEEKPPYFIKRVKHENDSKYDFNLWSVDEMRNMKEIIFTAATRNEILEYIKRNIEQSNETK